MKEDGNFKIKVYIVYKAISDISEITYIAKYKLIALCLLYHSTA